jgi:hypothetical protein
MNDEAPLLAKTIRTTALMVVPIAAFLAILSAVALFAVPQSTPKESSSDTADHAAPAADHEATTRPAGARAVVKPNKF